jgi:two-component system, chemotaxis family, sensor kinase CheA
MLAKIIGQVILPKQITAFERRYLERMNKIGLYFFALHIPVFVLLAYFNDTGPLLAGVLGLAVLVGPAIAFRTFRNPRNVSMTYGFTAMLMGGVLVHVGQGPVQIEMHFYFFALLAMLAVYANPLVILVAAVTVALHHLVLWIVLPQSVFNYEAPIWVVAVHAAFVVLESVATCYIARSFFDNVIGLEKIVQARTVELDARNRDMRLVLDNVGQGFISIDTRGVMSPERSAIVSTWLGTAETGETFAAYLSRTVPAVGEAFELGFQELLEGFLPMDMALEQMPARFVASGKTFSLTYKPIVSGEALEKLLIVVSDITETVERNRLEIEQREMVQMFHLLVRDRAGFLEFCDEARELANALSRDEIKDLSSLKRVLHTLKGNAAIFGIQSLSDLCHELETSIEEQATRPTSDQRAELARRFDRFWANLETLLGNGTRNTIDVDPAEYEETLRAALAGEQPRQLAQRLAAWKLEPTVRRLERVSEQAQRIAQRLNKAPLVVSVHDGNLRLEPARWASFWSAFVHVVRNSVDHGIEATSERGVSGKTAAGSLTLSTRVDRDKFVIEISDDGRGVDWQAIADRARASGLAHSTPAELMEAMFTDGISTAAFVSELSGRGVGMGALRAETLARGGQMRVMSSSGQGTRVEFSFPIAAMGSDSAVRGVAA